MSSGKKVYASPGGQTLEILTLKTDVGVNNLNTISRETRELYQSLRSELIGIHCNQG
jgi:hypothetical protein